MYMTNFADWEKYKFDTLMILINRRSCLCLRSCLWVWCYLLFFCPGQEINVIARRVHASNFADINNGPSICHILLYAFSSLVPLIAPWTFHGWINLGSGSFSDSLRVPQQVQDGCASDELISWLLVCYSNCSSGTTRLLSHQHPLHWTRIP